MRLKSNPSRAAGVRAGTVDEERGQIQKCPNCKQDISKAEWRAHFKVCVLEKNWKDQKQSRLDRTGGMN